jgi:hypothetical protein
MQRSVAVEIEKSPYRVQECHAYAGDEVEWDAGDLHITIWFPQAGLMSSATLDIDSGTGTLEVQSGAEPGTYSYAVYCHDTGEFLEGNSHPVMIIEPGP